MPKKVYDNGWSQLLQGDARVVLAELKPESVDLCVTSPPYYGLRTYKAEPLLWGGIADCSHEWGFQPSGRYRSSDTHPGPLQTPGNAQRGQLVGGLCKRCNAFLGQLGLEPTPERYIEHLLEVFRAVRRVLKPAATLWVNIGDTYVGSVGTQMYKAGDLIGIPGLLSRALLEDGWHRRGEIVWAKVAATPESVNGWRWEPHRIKIKKGGTKRYGDPSETGITNRHHDSRGLAEFSRCPGCPQCLPNDSLVLRKGSWRPTRSYELILMFSKGPSYYADRESVKQTLAPSSFLRLRQVSFWSQQGGDADYARTGINPNRSARGALENLARKYRSGNKERVLAGTERDRLNTHKGSPFPWEDEGVGANLRDVWVLETAGDTRPPGKQKHFATFPEALPETCILAGTPEAGVCSACGAPWARVVQHEPGLIRGGRYAEERGSEPSERVRENGFFQTLGWRPTCRCGASARPAVVLDPFCGTATTMVAAQKLGRRSIGVDLSPQYLAVAQERLAKVPTPMGMK